MMIRHMRGLSGGGLQRGVVSAAIDKRLQYVKQFNGAR